MVLSCAPFCALLGLLERERWLKAGQKCTPVRHAAIARTLFRKTRGSRDPFMKEHNYAGSILSRCCRSDQCPQQTHVGRWRHDRSTCTAFAPWLENWSRVNPCTMSRRAACSLKQLHLWPMSCERSRFGAGRAALAPSDGDAAAADPLARRFAGGMFTEQRRSTGRNECGTSAMHCESRTGGKSP